MSFKFTRTHERRKERQKKSHVGMPRPLLLRPVLGRSGASTEERAKGGPSPLGTREQKHNNKYCSFLNLCSSSIAGCKQCLIFVSFLIARNHWRIGLQWKPKPDTQVSTSAPGWNLLEAWRPFPQGACCLTVMDVRPCCPGARHPAWERPPSSPTSGSHLRETRRKSTKINSSFVEVWD